MRLYFFLFRRASTSRLSLHLYRKWAALLTLLKHLQRRNWRQALVWMRFLGGF